MIGVQCLQLDTWKAINVLWRDAFVEQSEQSGLSRGSLFLPYHSLTSFLVNQFDNQFDGSFGSAFDSAVQFYTT